MNKKDFKMSSMGEIHLILGPMYSGKTSELLKVTRKYKLLEVPVLNVNHVFDKRYDTGKIVSHDGVKTDCMQLKSLKDLYRSDEYTNSKVIVIEEGQFFGDLFEFVKESCYNQHKIVYVAGLNGDFEKKPMGQILDLIPHCDTLVKLSALCMICKDGTQAHFSKRIVNNSEDICVGSHESYIPVCRKHHSN